jgi:hypothetical protein
VLEVVRQKGEAELRAQCQHPQLVRDSSACNIRGTVCMQGSDVLATPDTMALFVVCKGTNRPGPFPGTVLAYIACLPGEWRVQTCCCFLEAMTE